MIEQFFMPFLVTWIRDIKSEGFTFMATPEMHARLVDMKINITKDGIFELNKLNKE